MPTIQLNAQLSAADLLHAVEQLEPGELNQFVSAVVALRARRQSNGASLAESELLDRINVGLAPERRTRYDDLVAKRRAEALSPAEHAELLQLTDEVEKLQAERARAVVELAQLRQQPLAAVLQELGILAS
jgi:hypothetical protein